MSNEALINALAADLAPVRVRSIRRETVVLGIAGTIELALFIMVVSMRPDMKQAIVHPFMWWKLASLALLVAISFTTALRSFSPGAFPRPGLIAIIGAVGLIATIGAFIDPGAAGALPLFRRLAPMHGLECAIGIVVLSAPMLVMLSVLMRRGASTHPEASAVAIGIAGGSWGALVFALRCPMNDPLYILLWYCVACATVTIVSRLTLPRISRL